MRSNNVDMRQPYNVSAHLEKNIRYLTGRRDISSAYPRLFIVRPHPVTHVSKSIDYSDKIKLNKNGYGSKSKRPKHVFGNNLQR